MKKFFFFFLVMTAMVALITGCGQAGSNTIKIGVAGAHTGDLASYGLPTVKAAELVVDAVNEKGGINGKKIELVVEDDECKPEKAANVASKLVGDKVVAVIGHICSGATKSALGIYNAANIVVISPSATNPDLTQSGLYPNFFRTIASDDMQAKLDVEFAVNSLKLKTFAVLHDKGDYGKGFAEFVKSFLEKIEGIKIVLFEGITPNQVDYSAVINKIEKEKAEAVIYGGYHPEASKLVAQMNKKKMNITFISDDGVKDDTFIKVAGADSEGVYASGPIDTSKNPLAVKAIEEHKAKYGEEPGAFFLNAYAAALALVNTIEKSGGSTKYDDLVKALRTQDVETPLGTIRFDDRGDAIGVGFAMFQVQDGKYVEVK
jgi:branched-chain amino acid transport system substrate-binding protein